MLVTDLRDRKPSAPARAYDTKQDVGPRIARQRVVSGVEHGGLSGLLARATRAGLEETCRCPAQSAERLGGNDADQGATVRLHEIASRKGHAASVLSADGAATRLADVSDSARCHDDHFDEEGGVG